MKQTFKSFYFNESHDGVKRICAWCDRTLLGKSNDVDPSEKPIPKKRQKGASHGMCNTCLKNINYENYGAVGGNAFPLQPSTFVKTPLSVGVLQAKVNPLKKKIKKQTPKKRKEKQ